MTMRKHCLFCNERAAWTDRDGMERFEGCMCAPEAGYSLRKDVYEAVRLFPYEKKRKLLPLVSASIRAGRMTSPLAVRDIEEIGEAPDIPGTVEEKEARLLHYLYDRTEGAESGVYLHPLSRHYNLAYCSTLQEFVYLIERLRENGMLEREGALLRLTERGAAEASARSDGSGRKLCTLIAGDEETGKEWAAGLLPGIEQCGYRTQLFVPGTMREMDEAWLERLAESKLIVADAADAGPELYYAAGYASRAGIRIIWTLNGSAPRPDGRGGWLRPLPWNSAAELMEMLRQRL